MIRNVVNPGNNVDIRANFLTQLSAASNGDEIVFPNGIFIMSNMTTVNKTVTIRGGGIGATTLYRSEAISDATLEGWTTMFYCSSPASFYDMTLKSKLPSSDNTGSDGLSIAIDNGIWYNFINGWQVKRCRFEYFGEAGITAKHLDAAANGLIANCEFFHNAKGSNGLGYGYGIQVYGEGNTWVADPRLGSSNFVFVEDNIFEFHRHSIASAGCSLYVFRYNTILNNLFSGPYIHAIDTHAARGPGNGSNSFGARASEIYNNTIVNNLKLDRVTPLSTGLPITDVVEAAICIRAGDALVYNNTIEGYRFATVIQMETAYSGAYSPGAYPWISQPGYSSGVKYGSNHAGKYAFNKLGKNGVGESYTMYDSGDAYYWNNTFTPYVSSPSFSSLIFYNYNTDWLVQERDYHLNKKLNYRPYTYPHP